MLLVSSLQHFCREQYWSSQVSGMQSKPEKLVQTVGLRLAIPLELIKSCEPKTVFVLHSTLQCGCTSTHSSALRTFVSLLMIEEQTRLPDLQVSENLETATSVNEART